MRGAVTNINTIKNFMGNARRDIHNEYLFEALQAANEALQKQIAQEVQNVYPTKVKETAIYKLTGDCPICSAPVPVEQRYCWSCGQRLDWSKNRPIQKKWR